jgi:5-methylcytosine-specific restriction endonuclease McrA
MSGGMTQICIGDSGMDSLTQKRCNKCGEWKDKSEFPKTNQKKNDGVGYSCKLCYREYRREFDKSHPRNYRTDKERERAKQKRIKFADKIAGYIRKWQQANPDKVRAKSLKWRNNHLEEARANWHEFIASKPAGWDAERKRKRYAENREAELEQARIRNSKRRARITGNGGEITKQEWSWLKEFYDFTCLRCGKREPEIKLTLDHVLPIKLGGKNVIENAQPLCQSCNSSKHTQHIDYRKARELI